MFQIHKIITLSQSNSTSILIEHISTVLWFPTATSLNRQIYYPYGLYPHSSFKFQINNFSQFSFHTFFFFALNIVKDVANQKQPF